MTVNGAKYTYSTKNNGFLSAIIAYGTTKSGFSDDQRTVYPSYTYLSKYDIENLTDKVSAAVHYTQKVNWLPAMALCMETWRGG